MQELFIKKKKKESIEKIDKCSNNGYSDAHLKKRKKEK
jgi:hypothetical protein